MEERTTTRLGRPVSVLGHGMWGLAGWKDTDDAEVERALDEAVSSGVTFFDTAFAYGDGRSEAILGKLVRRHPAVRFFTASKIPPKNRIWPASALPFRAAGVTEVVVRQLVTECEGQDLVEDLARARPTPRIPAGTTSICGTPPASTRGTSICGRGRSR